MMAAQDVEIDDSLYSRQRYMMGDNAMQRMANSSVLIHGLGGLGVEIAKNVVLAGVKSVTLQDSHSAMYTDLGTQFFLREKDVKTGRNRAEACVGQVSELNPYVTVRAVTNTLNTETDLSYLQQYQCVILTEASLAVQRRVNAFCRSQNPPIAYMSGDVYGVFCWAFCDFGADFEVVDSNGEDNKDCFISKITKANPGVVTTLENQMHGFESGNTVTFAEVQGMTALNGKQCQIKVLSPYAFSICDTSQMDLHTHSGIASQVKVPVHISFKSLEEELSLPSLCTPDLGKMDAPANIHLAMLALYTFMEKHGRMPNVWCPVDADCMVAMATEINEQTSAKIAEIDTALVRNLASTCQGCLAPLCASLGGIVGQEVLKAITGKFSPLHQWVHLDATELLQGLADVNTQTFQPQLDQCDALRICVGDDFCGELHNLRLFMVGCGAIGCEMLKNYALLGLGTTQGKITITDNDLIEKSNLNRQFLFRPKHIQKPKSTTGAAAAKEINPEIKVDAHHNKVCPQTESIYNDAFFEQQHVLVNALDNVEARRYMDSRCVTSQRPLLESGTMGAKGHVQVIIPHLTESYTSQQDPTDETIPYCTLKSFPAAIEHCIQWARDKFESSFVQKPAAFNKFWGDGAQPADVIKTLKGGGSLDGVVLVSKMAHSRCFAWKNCVKLGRNKFEKYFNHKGKNLLHAFPPDHKMEDDSLFWQMPKRQPTPVEFDENNPLHVQFVGVCARLYADMCGVAWQQSDLAIPAVVAALDGVKPPTFIPSSKKIVTNESASKEAENMSSGDELIDAAMRLQRVVDVATPTTVCRKMSTALFEKDDDMNGHIDFITAASNLRAALYGIESADRLKTKRIAGHIVPAIATTTAAVAGLVTLELLKVVRKVPLEHYRNCFLNLALPVFLLSEPGPVEKSTLSNGVVFSLWDRWEVQGASDLTMRGFMDKLKEKYKVEPSSVMCGVKMLYVPFLPPHKKRLTQTMLQLLKGQTGRLYVDLYVQYKHPGGAEEEMGPPVRYFFNKA